MEFKDVLRKKRKDKGYTQEDMAAKLNVTHAAYNRWEMGIHEPDLKKLITLANILDTPIDILLGRYSENK